MSISLKLAAPPSDDEVLELSLRNPGYQLERSAAGDLIVTLIGGETGRREVELGGQLSDWAKQHGGVAFGPSTGFHLADGSLLSPDTSWLSEERWRALTRKEREGFPPLCPDAVFEIRPWSDELWEDPRAEMGAKMRAYITNGARLAVLIDPERRTVEVFAPNRPPEVLEKARAVSCDPVLRGFTLDLEPIFA